MKLKALALALFVAGVCSSFALADDGHGKGQKSDDAATATATTGTTTPATEHGQKGKEHGDKKVTLCHKAGESGRWVKISVSKNAEKTHSRRGDVAPDAAGKCPAAAPATTTGSTTTGSTTTGSTTTGSTTTDSTTTTTSSTNP